MDILLELARQFLMLSLLSIGGVNALIPEIHRQIVDVNHWMADAQLTELFELSQDAPGPNFLIVTLLGLFIAGLPGAMVTTLAVCGPASLFTYLVAHLWDRFRDARWRIIVQRALAPVTVGLMFASGYVLTRASDHSIVAYGITAASVLLMLRTRGNPLAWLAAAAVLGALGVV